MQQKPSSSALHSLRETLLLVSYYIDGAVAASGISIMVLQGKEVQLPGAMYLTAYQLCYVLPQLLTTPLAERLTARFSSRRLLLPFTLIASLAATYVLMRSLAMSSLPLFFTARLLTGVLRHPKVFYERALTEDGTADATAVSAQLVSPTAMHLGLLSSAIFGDLWQDAVRTQHFFVCAEAAALALVSVDVLLAGASKPRGASGAVAGKPSNVTLCWRAVATLTTSANSSTVRVWAALATLSALRLAAGVNQCVYALVGPAFGLSYMWTAAHLVAQNRLVPVIALAVQRQFRTQKNASRWLLEAAAVALLAGTWAAPAVQSMGPWVYYPVTLMLVDVPTALASDSLVEEVTAVPGCPEAVRAGVGAGLLGHLFTGAKLFSAPVRLMAGVMLPTDKYAVRVVAVPAAVHVLAVALSGRFAVGVMAAVTCVSVLLTL